LKIGVEKCLQARRFKSRKEEGNEEKRTEERYWMLDAGYWMLNAKALL